MGEETSRIHYSSVQTGIVRLVERGKIRDRGIRKLCLTNRETSSNVPQRLFCKS